MNRRCTVLGTDAAGSLILQAADYGIGTAPVPRPIVGSSVTGLHTCPPVGAQVLVLHEHAFKPAAALTASDTLGTPGTLAAGESCLYGPRGDILSYASASGEIVLYRNSANTLRVAIDPSTNRLNVTASGGIWCNGVQITVP